MEPREQFKIAEPVRAPSLPKPNERCHCGSGKKYKKCCMREDKLPPDERGLLDPGPVPQHVKDATDKMLAEEGYTAEVTQQLLALERAKRRRGLLALAAARLWNSKA